MRGWRHCHQQGGAAVSNGLAGTMRFYHHECSRLPPPLVRISTSKLLPTLEENTDYFQGQVMLRRLLSKQIPQLPNNPSPNLQSRGAALSGLGIQNTSLPT